MHQSDISNIASFFFCSQYSIHMFHKPFLLYILLLIALTSHGQNNQAYRDSLKVASERLSFHPDSVEFRLSKASWNMLLEQWEYAKNEYDYILNRNPYQLTALYYRAYANERLRRYSFARLDYQNVLVAVPAHFEARLGLALLNQKDKRYTEAMDQINVLVEQHPDSAIAYAARAGIEKEMGLNVPAVYDYSEAIRLSPTQTDYILSRADLLIEEKHYAEAMTDLERLIALGVPKSSLTVYFQRLKKKK